MERHKEMDRDRIERERQQERERQDKQCNAEQAVTKHFEESLRRAKEKVCLMQLIVFIRSSTVSSRALEILRNFFYYFRD